MTDLKDKAVIMVVDDDKVSLDFLSSFLETHGYIPRPVPSGKLAIMAAKREPPDLVLLDVNMPDMNGYEVCAVFQSDEELKHVPIIFVSGYRDSDHVLKGLQSGSVDYIYKPFNTSELLARMEVHLKIKRLQKELRFMNDFLEDMVKEKIRELKDAYEAVIFAMAKLAEYRDDDTGKHLERVRAFSRALAEELARQPGYEREVNKDFIRTIYHASPLHDVGKVAIPDKILLKPGKLTPEEFEVVKTHTIRGAQTLEEVAKKHAGNEFIEMGIEIARHHHERWDGTGYPDGLEGENIPLSARIVAIADVYDALRSRRPYKEPFTHEKAVEIIMSEKGTHFDPVLVEVFWKLRDRFKKIYECLRDNKSVTLLK